MQNDTLVSAKVGNKIYTAHESKLGKSLHSLLDKMNLIVVSSEIEITRGFGDKQRSIWEDESALKVIRKVNTERLLQALPVKRKETR